MKIYLAGIEQINQIQNILESKLIKNGFVSYYYERNRKLGNMKYLREHVQSIIVDSGAHTFFSEMTGSGLSVSVHSKKTKTKETPDEYWSYYKKWLVENTNYFDYFVELDIGEIVGQEKVMQWREELKKLGLYHKCIIVYHPNIVTIEQYKKDLDDSLSKYVALEGDRPNRSRLPYGKLIQIAYNKGVKIHGFAMTKENVFMKYPFYSVDSTSWKAGTQYGTQKTLTNAGIKLVRFKNKTHLLSIKDSEMAYNSMSNDKKKSIQSRLLLAIKAYRKKEDELTRLWRKRGLKFN